MIDQDMVNRLHGCQVIDHGGEKIGSVDHVWLDGRTGHPVWASVNTGLLGLRESFVPLQRAELHGGQMRVPVSKDQVKDSPRIEAADGQLTDEEQMALYRHYGIPGPGGAGAGDASTGPYGRGTQRGQVSGSSPERAAASGDDAMTRSEERLNVGFERDEIGRVRLVKHVETENQQVTVPVSHEEVRLEREPITDANRDAALEGPEISTAEHEVRLHADKPVVRKETVPVERVRLTKDTVTERQTVSDQVRKEQIEVEDDSGQVSRRRDDRRGRPPQNQR